MAKRSLLSERLSYFSQWKTQMVPVTTYSTCCIKRTGGEKRRIKNVPAIPGIENRGLFLGIFSEFARRDWRHISVKTSVNLVETWIQFLSNTEQDFQPFYSVNRYYVICWIGDKVETGFEGCMREHSQKGEEFVKKKKKGESCAGGCKRWFTRGTGESWSTMASVTTPSSG